jgi:hypothetical protein
MFKVDRMRSLQDPLDIFLKNCESLMQLRFYPWVFEHNYYQFLLNMSLLNCTIEVEFLLGYTKI